MKMTNFTEISSNETLDLDCPVYTETSDEWIDFWNFWVGGVFQSFVAIPGFIAVFRGLPMVTIVLGQLFFGVSLR